MTKKHYAIRYYTEQLEVFTSQVVHLYSPTDLLEYLGVDVGAAGAAEATQAAEELAAARALLLLLLHPRHPALLPALALHLGTHSRLELAFCQV